MATEQFKAKSLKEIYSIVSRPATVFKDKNSELASGFVKTDTSVITVTDPSTGKDVSVVKSSVYSFNGIETRKGLGNILSINDINIAVATGAAYDKLAGYNTIVTYKDLVGETAYLDKAITAPRQAGAVVLNSNFELKFTGPLDARVVAETPSKLYDPDWWLADSGGYVYLYRGMLVSVKSSGDVYTYMGPDIEIKSNNPTIAKAISSSNWKLINSTPASIRNKIEAKAEYYGDSVYTDASALLLSGSVNDNTAKAALIGKNIILIGNHTYKDKPMYEIDLRESMSDYSGLMITGSDDVPTQTLPQQVVLRNTNGDLILEQSNLDTSGNIENLSRIQLNSLGGSVLMLASDKNDYNRSEVYVAPDRIIFKSDYTKFGDDWHFAVNNRNKEVIYRGDIGEEGDDSDNYEEYNHVRLSPFDCTINMNNHSGGGSINLISDTIRLWNRKTRFLAPTASGQTPIFRYDASTGMGDIVWQQSDSSETITNQTGESRFMKVVSNIATAQRRINSNWNMNNVGSSQYLYYLSVPTVQSFILTIECDMYSFKAEITVRYAVEQAFNMGTEPLLSGQIGQPVTSKAVIKPSVAMKVIEYTMSSNTTNPIKFTDAKDDTSEYGIKCSKPLSVPIGLSYKQIQTPTMPQIKYMLSFYIYAPANQEIVYNIKPKVGAWNNDTGSKTTVSMIDNTSLDVKYSWANSYDAAREGIVHPDHSLISHIYNDNYIPVLGLKFDQDMTGAVNTMVNTNQIGSKHADLIKQIISTTGASSIPIKRYGIPVDILEKYSDLAELVNGNQADVISILFYLIADLQKKVYG